MPTATLSDGLEVHYEDHDFSDPSRTPETIILQHGTAKNARLWYRWVPLLANAFRVVRPDLRGHGESSVPEAGFAWSHEQFARDLAQLMDHLEIERAHLIGETMGGTIALQFALDYPARVSTLTVCSSVINCRDVPVYWDMYEQVKTQGVEAWVRSQGAAYNRPEWYMQEMMRTDQRVLMELLAYITTVDLTPRLAEIPTPALALTGALARQAEGVRAIAHGLPNGHYAEVPGVAGYVQAEAPEACVALWRQFAEPYLCP